jgi:hypothetical protein
MAEAGALQAYARAADLLGRPDYVATAKKVLPVFNVRPPLGIRTRGPFGGVTYLQYSFAPHLYIFNAFTQALVGLWDFGKLTGDQTALARYREGEPELRRLIPHSDIGDWTLYSYRGPQATASYHELLREEMADMCIRHLGEIYCKYAAKYHGYQVDPPVLKYKGPATARKRKFTRLRFSLSKLSVVQVDVYKGSKLAFHKLATFRRGTRSFLWKPRSGGDYTVKLAAKELRTGMFKRGKTTGELTVSG